MGVEVFVGLDPIDLRWSLRKLRRHRPLRHPRQPFYEHIDGSVPKLKVTVRASHGGQSPIAGMGAAGEVVLAFQKLLLDGDERWRSLLQAIEASTLQ